METQETQPKTNLFEKVIACEVSLNKPGGSKKIKNPKMQTSAQKKMLRASKKLWESSEFDSIGAYDQQIYLYMNSRCLPSILRRGIYLVPIEIVADVDNDLDTMRLQREILINAFLKVYSERVAEAKELLADLFNEADYPPVNIISKEFAFRIRYIDMGVPQGLAGISQDIFKKAKQKYEAEWTEALEEIKILLRQEMLGLVNHLVDRLTPDQGGVKKIIKDAPLKNLNDFLSNFSIKNIANDQELTALVNKARDLSNGVNAEMLRDTATLRETLQNGFAEIGAVLEKSIEDAPIRKITFKKGEV